MDIGESGIALDVFCSMLHLKNLTKIENYFYIYFVFIIYLSILLFIFYFIYLVNILLKMKNLKEVYAYSSMIEKLN
jgi:hypothetical protein